MWVYLPSSPDATASVPPRARRNTVPAPSGRSMNEMLDNTDPDLTPKVLETSETSEMNEIYSGYLIPYSTIDSVWYDEIIEWE